MRSHFESRRLIASLSATSLRRFSARVLTHVALALTILVLAAEGAHAAAPGSGATFDESNVNYDPGPAQRRGGFMIGISQHMGYGVYRGYPLEVSALNDPDELQTTGPAFASQINVWLGAALRDFFAFGVGVTTMGAQGKQIGGTFGFLIHLEAYPLFYKGGFYQDFGLTFDGGLAASVILEREDGKAGDTVAEGGSMSTLGFGAFWEPLRFWHFSAGPAVNYVYGFSQTMRAHQGTLGFRFVFYGKQPKRTKSTERPVGTSTETAILSFP